MSPSLRRLTRPEHYTHRLSRPACHQRACPDHLTEQEIETLQVEQLSKLHEYIESLGAKLEEGWSCRAQVSAACPGHMQLPSSTATLYNTCLALKPP